MGEETGQLATHHIPVLLNELLTHLALSPGMTVIDATLGGGGMTCALATAIAPSGRVLAIDRDYEAITRFLRSEQAKKCANVTVAHGRFNAIVQLAKTNGIDCADRIIADLGVSRDHFDDAQRGFSILNDGPLDMRLDRDESGTPTAATIVNTWGEDALRTLIRNEGGETYARVITRAIVERRSVKPFRTTADLAAVISEAVKGRRGKIHPATKTFQALRRVVNDEDGELRAFLPAAFSLLSCGGRLAVMTFHSGEDRVVKDFFSSRIRPCECLPTLPVCVCRRRPVGRLVVRRPLAPSPAEVSVNHAARSARLRIIEKIAEEDDVPHTYYSTQQKNDSAIRSVSVSRRESPFHP